MPIPIQYLAEFEEEEVYHVYNRTNNKEALFADDENRRFFLRKYKELLSPFVDSYCWCLLPNHFHLLVKVKMVDSIATYLQSKPPALLTITEKRFVESADRLKMIGELIEQSFKRFFQSYAMSFNKQQQRSGNLFHKPFRRVKIMSDEQFTMAIIYIHANAVKHGLAKDMYSYPWSSWHTIVSTGPTKLLREDVIKWFGGLNACIQTHNELTRYYYQCDVAIEED